MLDPDQLTAMQQHIHDLQARLAHQEDMLQSLNDTIVDQDASIRHLQVQLKHYKEKLEDLSYGTESPSQQLPPHY